ncbi:hypothetical protein CORC01_00944 [Colletotrichum orchidophilum]|uniref:Uncharacterized protein n=1 Tax=Colletotrichum orchidophilum TaxID=1209926 RepID=A0A1G4BQM5_9PEZI|nr:uncharacterized protein CORC01_00944 [Colletotrichum orchidophilum]OHF03625.1 hypothetical protein CORC01_00944 [Colletotrichum orchidophilum]
MDPDTIANVLQLAAKLHEILIVASLSAIMLSMFRRRLMTSGVRLGFLTGGYRAGDLYYLGTSAFRRHGLHLLQGWDLFLASFLVFTTVMSTVVGPASAVLLVPTLGWYNFTGSGFDNDELQLASYVTAKYASSKKPPPVHMAAYQCENFEGVYQEGCPAAGFSQISSWISSFGSTDLTNNLTFQSTSSDIRRHLLSTQDEPSINSATLSTTPAHHLMASIGLFQKYIDNVKIGAISEESRYRLITRSSSHGNVSISLHQPFVQSKCDVYNKKTLWESKDKAYYPVDFINCYGNVDCDRVKKHGKAYARPIMTDPAFDDDSLITNFMTWNPKYNISVVFLTGQLPNSTIVRDKKVEEHLIYLCTLSASWAPSTLSLDPKVSDVLQSSLDHDSMRALYRNVQTSTMQNPNVHSIPLSNEWLHHLNPSWAFADNSANTTALSRIVSTFSAKDSLNGTTRFLFAPVSSVSNDTAAEALLAKVFGVFLTEGLARLYFGATTGVITKKDDTELAFLNFNQQHGVKSGSYKFTPFNATHHRFEYRGVTTVAKDSFETVRKSFDTTLHIDLHAERFGYGTGQQRGTLMFAQILMYIYLGAVAAYGTSIAVGWVLEYFGAVFRGKRFHMLSVVPWADLQDLVILLLQTPPSCDESMKHASVGATSSKVWEKIVRLKADDELKMTLVLDEADDSLPIDQTGRHRYF